MSEVAKKEIVNVLFAGIEGGKIAFPDALIAEIVDFVAVHSDSDDVPTWYLGELVWRGITVPLVALEGMNTDAFFRQSKQLKIIVMHGVYNREVLPYWAFVTSETPKMQRIPAEAMDTAEAAVGSIEKMRIELYGDSVMLPDIINIEEKLKKIVNK